MPDPLHRLRFQDRCKLCKIDLVTDRNIFRSDPIDISFITHQFWLHALVEQFADFRVWAPSEVWTAPQECDLPQFVHLVQHSVHDDSDILLFAFDGARLYRAYFVYYIRGSLAVYICLILKLFLCFCFCIFYFLLWYWFFIWFFLWGLDLRLNFL